MLFNISATCQVHFIFIVYIVTFITICNTATVERYNGRCSIATWQSSLARCGNNSLIDTGNFLVEWNVTSDYRNVYFKIFIKYCASQYYDETSNAWFSVPSYVINELSDVSEETTLKAELWKIPFCVQHFQCHFNWYFSFEIFMKGVSHHRRPLAHDLLYQLLQCGRITCHLTLIIPRSRTERYGSTLLPATREQHDQNCTQSH